MHALGALLLLLVAVIVLLTCIIVVQVVSPAKVTLQLGLIVDAVEEAININAGDIETTPDFGARVDTGYLLGMARIKGSVKTLLVIDRVLTEETLQSLSPPVAAP